MTIDEAPPDALRRALAALRDMKERLERAEGAAHEPIAVIGAGCRFPGGVSSPESYWELLRSGTDAVDRVPADRWDAAELYDPDPDAPGKICTDQGGFVDWPVDRFDAAFFGISPREAASLDPQQRLLLEVTWEALEHAGVRADRLAGSPTGVFVGMGTTDYANLQMRTGDPADIGTYFGTGVAPCIAAGRLSYLLGLRGPALTLDTACSSSLVAVVLALQSLRAGTCRMALAGGVNLMLDPQPSIFLSRFRALSPSGRCHTFSAAADGYARGEGCGVVVLKRLSDAVADGDRVMAVIRGAAVNHDGRSSGLTVPSGAAQRAVIEQALADAELAPLDVDVVEAHGTGTELGDPIEVRALDAVYGRGRSAEQPLLLGSAKTNLGHLEAAAGVAGLLKLVLALQHEHLPAHLHFEEPSPHIDWDSLAVSVIAEGRTWPRGESPRRAAVSAFGFSGTNAHVVVEEAPTSSVGERTTDGPVQVVTLSARDEVALGALAERFADALVTAASLEEVAWTTQTGRARFPHRLAVVAASPAEAAERLRAWPDAAAPAGVVHGSAASASPQVAFVFSGQGVQHPRMGRELWQREPVFTAALTECDELLRPHLARPLLEVMFADDPGIAELINQTEWTQPALFALEYGLARQWMAWGVHPGAVAGHSIGELVAACVAGVLSLDDALRLIAARGRLMGKLPAGGAMLAVLQDEDVVRDLIRPYGGQLGLAAINASESVVVSGDGGAVEALVAQLAAAGIGHRRLQVSHAFHSPLMAPMLDELAAVADDLTYHPPAIPLVSAVTGRFEDGSVARPGHWVDHVMATVRFGDAAKALLTAGVQHFVELGPQPTLLGLLARAGATPTGLHPSLRPGRDGSEQMAESLAGLWVGGVEPDWPATHPGRPSPAAAPTYPFQREHHWFEPSRPRSRVAAGPTVHPLVHRRLESPAIAGHVYEATISVDEPSYLDDHRVFDVAVVPAAALLEMVVAAVRDAFGAARPPVLTDIVWRDPLVLPDDETSYVQVTLSAPELGRVDFGVHSQSGPGEWRTHASGTVELADLDGPDDLTARSARLDPEDARARATGTIEPAAWYKRRAAGGRTCGPTFQAVEEIVWGDDWAMGRVALPPTAATAEHHLVHPGLLDGALQLADAVLLGGDGDEDEIVLPTRVGRYEVVRAVGTAAWARAVLGPPGAALDRATVDVELFDDDGALVAALRDVELRRVDSATLRRQLVRAVDGGRGAARYDRWLHEPTWIEVPAVAPCPETDGSWLILTSEMGLEEEIEHELRRRGADVRVVVAEGDEVAQRLGELEVPPGGWAGVALAPGTAGRHSDDEAATGHDHLRSLLEVVQHLARRRGCLADGGRLVVLTRGAQPVGDEGPVAGLADAPLWGLATVVALEEPALRIACIDRPRGPVDDVVALVDELLSSDREDRVAYRSGSRYAARLVPSSPEEAVGVELDGDGTYLVTGGLGGLGLEAARTLAKLGASHLALMGRREPTEDAQTVIDELRADGVTVAVVAADVADRAGLEGALATLRRTMPPLRGVLHAAGVIDDVVVRDAEWPRIEGVLRPKVVGAWNLHELTAHDDLELFVLYSSTSSLLGAGGQAGYAAANAFLDALAHHRTALGQPGLTINWGPWSTVGMAAGLDELSRRRLLRRGIDLIDPVDGDLLLRRLLSTRRAQVGVIPIDWSRAVQDADAGMDRPFLERLTHEITAAAGVTSARFVEQLAAAPVAERDDLVREHTRSAIAAVLGLPDAGSVPDDVDLAELGLDSLMAVELRNRLQRSLGVAIEATAAFDHPTLARLAQHLADELLATVPAGAGEDEPAAARSALASIPAVPRVAPLPASPAQLRFLFMSDFEPTAAVYNVATALRVSGDLDQVALDEALTEVVRRHEALRTGFQQLGGDVVQVVADPPAVCFERQDLTGLDPEEQHQALLDLLDAEAARPFDVRHDLKLRGLVVCLGPADHAILTTSHHVAADGWSASRILRDLEELYRARVEGVPADLVDLPIQYADYSVWEREQLARPELQEQLDHWRLRLGGSLPVLALPTDRPRPAVRTYDGGSVRFDLAPELVTAIRAASREAGVTPFMLLVASYVATLARHAGQDEVVVGTVHANRSQSELNDVVGPFVNTLALRVGFDPDAPFAVLLDEVKRTAVDAYSHQDVPFDRVVEAVNPPRDLSRSPIFQTMFILQNIPVPEPKLGDLDVELIPLHSAAVDTDLTVELLDLPTGMAGELKYNRDLFDADTMERLVGHWLRLLAAATDDDARPVRALPMLAESEQDELLEASDGPAMPVPAERLHELVSLQAARSPDAVAVRMGDVALNYGDLEERADRLAGHLCRLGVEPGDRVGVAVERSPMMVVALLGILKAGAAYLPLDPSFPRDRLAYMVADAGCRTIVTSASVDLEGIGRPGDLVIDLDREWPTIDAGAASGPPTAGGVLAYTIYTSGSTGRPKGVEIEHRSAVNFLLAMQREPGLGPDDVVLGLTTLSFDISVLEIFLPLITGAQLVLASREQAADGVALARLIERFGCSLVQATPTTWSMLLASGWTGRAGLTALCGGEEMARDLADRLLVRCEVLWNVFGPTETTVWSTAGAVARGGTGPVSIGRPIANTVCRVLDPAGGLVPVGVAGELFIGGAGVARGYHERPDLDAERFVPDPFGLGRLYRTGDLARWTRDGQLEFLGRMDQQVKVRGHRIELGEIEHHLAAHPLVRVAAVTTWQAAPGDVRLVGYYVPVGGPVESGELRDHLRQMLPAYMVPSAFVPIDALPLTPNQKVDRSRLPAPQVAEDRAVRRAETVLQGELVAIWADVLGGEVGVDDDFFDLGGHSLVATQIVSRVRSTLGVEMPVRVMFEHPTVAGLADWIDTARVTAGVDALLPRISPVGRDRPLPLTASQERMWFISELQPDSAGYNMPGAIRLRGPLDVEALAASLDDLVTRHEGLRTTFPMEDGRPVQRIAPSGHVALEVVDRRSAPERDPLAEVMDEMRVAAERPFRLAELPLLRCTVYVLAEDDHVLFVNMHHIVGDQWSFGVIGRDLAAFYDARRAGRSAELAPLTVQFGDYAHWHREWVDGGAIDGQLAYWREQLAGHPTIDLPADRPRPPIQTGRGARLAVPLPDVVLAGIDQLCVQQRVSPFMVLLAALDLVVHRYASADDVVIGTPIANRNWLESEGLIGAFVNTIVMRTDVSGDPTFSELLARVQRVALDGYANQDAPFATVVNELHPVRDLSRSPLFQIFLNVLNAPVAPLQLKGVTAELLDLDRGAAQFDLSLSVDLTIARTIILEYSTDLFDRSTMERLGGHVLAVLRTVVADPELRVGDVVLLSEHERAELDALSSGRVVEVEDGVAAHTLVERQVARAPHRVAVRSDAEIVSYGELDARANRLAHHLIAQGVTRGDIVGIHLERSVEMVVAVLAVLKAGSAYLPLDPALPAGRLTFMLEDTAAGLVISREQARLAATADDGATPKLVLLDADADVIAACSSHDPRVPVDSHDRAHVIYTSGSTGRPKGVEVEHHSVVSFLQAMASEPGISPDDVVLAGTTLSFDPSVLELFLPLMHGAQLVIADRSTMLDPAALADLLRRAGITIMQATPTTWRMLVEDGWEGEPGLTALYGGEPMPADLLTSMLERCRELWNLYGPTETTVWATVHRVQGATERVRGAVPVGRPVDNTCCYVLDVYGHPQPLGVPGELHIGGEGVGRGYLYRPELTAERFVPDPFAGDPAARMYRTGDLARLLPDGDLDLLGRVDHQVKVRGHRIELGEIEQTLSSHPAVRAAAVTTWIPAPGDVRLVAYYIPDEAQAVDADELRTFLRVSLPAYMIPAAYVEMDAFPLTSSNKVARNELPAPTIAPRSRSRRGPETALQADLVRIWGDVLGQSDVSIDDDFFDLGGHSLLATRVFAAMEESTGRRLPLSALFQAPTIEDLARRYDESWTDDGERDQEWTSLIAMQPQGTRPPFFYVSPFLITILSFSHLARCMQPDQPFFLFQPQGMEGDHPVHETVEEMAAHYISEMRQVQESGPYHIGGHCAGSWVAFEMACQLQHEGEEVALLLAVDSEPPGVTPPTVPLRHVAGRLRSYWRDGALRESLRWQVRVRKERHISRRFGSGETQRLAALRYAHAEAHRHYQADGVFDGDLVLIRSEDWAGRNDKDWHLQWQDRITGELVLDTVEGSHGDLVANTTASALAEKIRAAVDRAPSLLWLLPLLLAPALTG